MSISTTSAAGSAAAGSRERVLRIGTRGSVLATTQAGTVRDALVAAGHRAELVIVRTAGDESSAPVAEIGVGVFTAELREQLAAGAVDLAVHSYKDLPTAARPPLRHRRRAAARGPARCARRPRRTRAR